MRHGEQRFDPLGDSGDAKRPLSSLTGSIRAYDAAEPGRVHIGHAGQIHNDRLAGFLAHHMLEIEEGLDGERSDELEDFRA